MAGRGRPRRNRGSAAESSSASGPRSPAGAENNQLNEFMKTMGGFLNVFQGLAQSMQAQMQPQGGAAAQGRACHEEG